MHPLEQGSLCEGYRVDSMAPWRWQKWDVDTKAHYGHVAVYYPANNLERVRGTVPAIHPWERRGGHQFISAVAACRGRTPQPPPKAVHLEHTYSTGDEHSNGKWMGSFVTNPQQHPYIILHSSLYCGTFAREMSWVRAWQHRHHPPQLAVPYQQQQFLYCPMWWGFKS